MAESVASFLIHRCRRLQPFRLLILLLLSMHPFDCHLRCPDGVRRGAALVELALVLPLFLLVVVGIIEFGRAMMVGQLVTNAARHGTRLAILDGSTNSAVEAQVVAFLVETVGVDPDDVMVTIEVEPYPGNPHPNHDLSLALPRDTCRVQVRIPYSRVGYMTGTFLQSAQLRGSCSMRHE